MFSRCLEWLDDDEDEQPLYDRLQKETYLLLERSVSSTAAFVVQAGVMTTITISILAFVLETIPELLDRCPPSCWLKLELTCTVIFTVEYLLRIWACRVAHPNRWDYCFKPLNLVDLAAILPYYIDFFSKKVGANISSDPLRFLRVFRLLRSITIFRVLRYFNNLDVIVKAIRNSRHLLMILLYCVFIGLFSFSVMIFSVEKLSCARLENVPESERAWVEKQQKHRVCENKPVVGYSPYGLCCDEFGAPLEFPSVIQACWWSVATITTVGFGDVLIHTPASKLVAVIVLLGGIMLIALPTAVIGAKFRETYDDEERDKVYKRREGLKRKSRTSGKLNKTVLRQIEIVEKEAGIPWLEKMDWSTGFKDEEQNELMRKLLDYVLEYKRIYGEQERCHTSVMHKTKDLLHKLTWILNDVETIFEEEDNFVDP